MDLPGLQTAIRALPGVRWASVRWPEPDAPAFLEITFDDDVDEAVVTERVAEAVEQILGVDFDELEVRRTSRGHTATVPVGEVASDREGEEGQVREPMPRPVFSGLKVDRQQFDTHIDVTLQYRGRTATGSAWGLATHQHTAMTASSATLVALREFLPSGVAVQVDWVDILEGSAIGRPTVLQVAVTALRASGEERHIGTAMARGDLREAAVRATLDALNRPLERLAAAS
jgi:hypothetical protein